MLGAGGPVVYRGSAYIGSGLLTFDAFHAALADGAINSSDRSYDELERVRPEPDEME